MNADDNAQEHRVVKVHINGRTHSCSGAPCRLLATLAGAGGLTVADLTNVAECLIDRLVQYRMQNDTCVLWTLPTLDTIQLYAPGSAPSEPSALTLFLRASLPINQRQIRAAGFIQQDRVIDDQRLVQCVVAELGVDPAQVAVRTCQRPGQLLREGLPLRPGHLFVVGDAQMDIPAYFVVERRVAVRDVGPRALRCAGQGRVGGAEVERNLLRMRNFAAVFDEHGA